MTGAEKMRRWRAKHPEKARAAAARDYAQQKAREAVEPKRKERRLAKIRQWCEENRERVALRARERYEALRVDPVAMEELRRKNRDGMLRYRGKPANRQKVRARWLTGAWIRRGKLKRRPCVVCGSEFSESHHEDYSKPLAVVWLCRKHHMDRHRKDSGE